ncbi:MAG: hypothetical protein NTV70_11915 [Acidobacteria bacterium]|nr:hypothetical protein [Acidobacteriota bacterium]
MAQALTVRINGGGVAAACCKALLAQAQVAFDCEPAPRPKVPAVMLSPATQSLLTDVFARQDLFEGLHLVRRRLVLWGSGDLVAMPHSAVVVSEEELLKRLSAATPAREGTVPEPAATWTIQASGTVHGAAPMQQFGARPASATRVKLTAAADPHACCMEAVPGGWLFLVPSSVETAWLLAAGGPPETLLGQSQQIGPQVDGLSASGGTFPAHPRIAEALCADGWLACGSAAIAFDPLCGDGTGHAVREAILACAITRAEGVAASPDDLLWEYRLRLWSGFKRHLEHCHEFYATGGTSDWWKAQCAAIEEGLRWMAVQRSPVPLGRYRLNGFSLERTAG